MRICKLHFHTVGSFNKNKQDFTKLETRKTCQSGGKDYQMGLRDYILDNPCGMWGCIGVTGQGSQCMSVFILLHKFQGHHHLFMFDNPQMLYML